MNINDQFPSKYLKAADLQGRNVTVKMARVEQEKIGDDMKLILYFQGKERGVVLNKTNANNIASLYGGETEDWYGMDGAFQRKSQALSIYSSTIWAYNRGSLYLPSCMD